MAPIKFRSPKEGERQISVKCKDADKNIVKESYPKYTSTHPKNFLKIITKLKVLEQCYNWCDEGNTDFSIHNLGRAIDERAIKKWFTLTCAQVTSAAMYKMKVQESVQKLLGKDAEDEQKQYFEDMVQPSDMNMIEYVKTSMKSMSTSNGSHQKHQIF